MRPPPRVGRAGAGGDEAVLLRDLRRGHLRVRLLPGDRGAGSPGRRPSDLADPWAQARKNSSSPRAAPNPATWRSKASAMALGKEKGQAYHRLQNRGFPGAATAPSVGETRASGSPYLDVDGEGFVNLDQLEHPSRDETILVSVQHANQEIGTVQDIEAIGGYLPREGSPVPYRRHAYLPARAARCQRRSRWTC